MSIELWDWLEHFNWLVGADFPEADEDALWRCSDAWASAAADLRRLSPDVVAVGQHVISSVGGATGTAFTELWQQYSGPHGLVERTATACEQLAVACDSAAVEVEYAKIQYIAALTVLAGTLAALTAALVAGGISALGMPAAIAAAQFTIRVLLMRLLAAMVMGALVNTALDTVAQGIQMIEGHRRSWDLSKTGHAVEDGAIYGGIGAGVFLAAGRFAPGLLRKPVGLVVPLAATGGLGGVAAPLAHGQLPTGRDFLLALTSGVVGGVGPDLVHGRASAPDLSRLDALDHVSVAVDSLRDGTTDLAGQLGSTQTTDAFRIATDPPTGPTLSGADAVPATIRSAAFTSDHDGGSHAPVPHGDQGSMPMAGDRARSARPEDPGQLAGTMGHHDGPVALTDARSGVGRSATIVDSPGGTDPSGVGSRDRGPLTVRPESPVAQLYLGGMPTGVSGVANPAHPHPDAAGVGASGSTGASADPAPGSARGGAGLNPSLLASASTSASGPAGIPNGPGRAAAVEGSVAGGPTVTAAGVLLPPPLRPPAPGPHILAAGPVGPHVAEAHEVPDQVTDTRHPELSGVDRSEWTARGDSSGHLPEWRGPDSTLTGPQNLAADLILDRARQAEPRITTTVRDIARDVGGSLLGEENRLKTEDSLKSKLARLLPNRTLPQALGQLRDTLRYTVGLPEHRYAQGAQNTIDSLLHKGFQPVAEFRSWRNQAGYLGYNSFWSDPGSGHVFEVQIHTESSFVAKTVSHGLYDHLREMTASELTTSEGQRLKAEHDAYFDAVRIPDGAVDVRVPPEIPRHDPVRDLPPLPHARFDDDLGPPTVDGSDGSTPVPDSLSDGVRRYATDAEAVRLAHENVLNTDAGLAFYGAADDVREYARAVHPTDGYVTIDVHGSGRGFQIGNTMMTATQFADALVDLRDAGVLNLPDGAGIKLLSCDTARGGRESPAAVLARRLGVEVVAPDQPVWTALDGDEVVASPTIVNGNFVPTYPPDGTWYRFIPVSTSGSSSVTAEFER